ncbi:MAG: putative toxin-antitoxin system toxin component, PIN family [Muribaculaceae bacterium]|nr:putative toxin-antitoxin system toxin component, PIN family [Muribaculaceae bacterium]
MNLILDTNIWISFLLGKRLSILSEIFKRNDIQIFVSPELIEEINKVATRNKFKSAISQQSLQNLIELINVRCNWVSSCETEENNLRDKKDLFILGMALNSSADFIVSGDKDLLVLNQYKSTKIITFSEFKNLIFIE